MRWPLPDGEIDLAAGEIRRHSGISALNPVEVRLLRYLCDRPGTSVPVDELLVEVWGYHPNAKTRAVYFGVRKLRERLEIDPARPSVLVGTERRGFRLAQLAPAAAMTVVAQPCPDDEALAHVAAEAPELDPDLCRAVIALGCGVPDVVRLLAVRARALPPETIARLLAHEPGALDARLSDAVDELLAALPAELRIGLEALASAGAVVPAEPALSAVGARALAALVDQGPVRLDDSGYRTLPWVAARARALEPELRGTLRLAEALQGPHGGPALRGVVERLVDAGHPLAGPACVRLLRSAHQAGVDDAVLRLAQRLAHDPVVVWWKVLVADATMLGRHEVLPHVEAAFPAAAARLSGDALAEAWSYLARFRREHGAVAAAATALDEARRHAILPGRIDLELAYLRRAAGHIAAAERPAELAVRALRGTPLEQAALGALCTVRIDQGLPEEAVALLDRALAQAAAATDRIRSAIHFRRANALRAAERWDDALADLGVVEALSARLGDPHMLELAGVTRVLVLLDADRPADAARRCTETLAACTPSSDLADSLRVLFELATLRDTGRSTGLDLERWAASLEPNLPVPDRLELSAWQAEIVVRRGDRDEGRAAAARGLAEAEQAGFHARSPIRRALARALAPPSTE